MIKSVAKMFFQPSTKLTAN